MGVPMAGRFADAGLRRDLLTIGLEIASLDAHFHGKARSGHAAKRVPRNERLKKERPHGLGEVH
jgi:hypothetical protein